MEWIIALIAAAIMPLGMIFGGYRDVTPSVFERRKSVPRVNADL